MAMAKMNAIIMPCRRRCTPIRMSIAVSTARRMAVLNMLDMTDSCPL